METMSQCVWVQILDLFPGDDLGRWVPASSVGVLAAVLASTFCLAKPELLQTLGSEPVDGSSLFLSNKWDLKHLKNDILIFSASFYIRDKDYMNFSSSCFWTFLLWLLAFWRVRCIPYER